MSNFDLVNLALKATCPGNEIILDNAGLPSVMVRIPRFRISDVITGGSSGTHPAFIVNGAEVPEIFISKFQNVTGPNGRAYSLPGEDPRTFLSFDAARTACELKGAGWHLMTNAEWAALALWCRRNNLMPRGNNLNGRDHGEATVVAIPTSDSAGDTFQAGETIGRVATGTGPVQWSHNGEVTGVFDLNGNVWEWVGGYRTVEGELQVLPNNNAASILSSQAVGSTAWRAILQDGSLVTPGTAGSLKWDYSAAVPPGGTGGYAFRLNTVIANPADNDTAHGTNAFATLAAAGGVSVPEILRALALMPADAGDHASDNMWMRNRGERFACRGGDWFGGSSAGVFACHCSDARSGVGAVIGFRSAFIPGI